MACFASHPLVRAAVAVGIAFAGLTVDCGAAPPLRVSSVPVSSARPSAHRTVDWPQLGFDPGHAGLNPYEHTITPQNVQSLTQLWSFTIDDWPGDIVENGGILFIPSASGTLYAVDASTGQQLWTFSSGISYGWNTGAIGVATDSGLLFTMCNLPSGGQGVCALQGSTGSLQWSYAATGSSPSITAPPTVANGIVYVEACSSAGCGYVALNESDGSTVWRQSELCSANRGFPLAVYEGLVFVEFGCSQHKTNILALSAANGSLVWNRKVTGITTGLTAGQGVVAYGLWNGSEQYIGVLKAARGKPLWGPTPINSKYMTIMPAIAYHQIYSWIFINDYGYIADYDAHLGTQYWLYTIARSFPSVANQVIYIAMNGGPLALNADNGQELWHFGGTDNLGLPIIVNGVVYGGCNGSHVCAYGLPGTHRRTGSLNSPRSRT